MTTIQTEKIIAADGEISDLVDAATGIHHVVTYMHEDGSFTVINWDELGYLHSPREYDNLAMLVSTHRDYLPMDEADSDLETMRRVVEHLDDLSGTWTTDIEEHEEWADRHLVIEHDDGWHTYLDLDDDHESWVALAYFEGWDAEETMQRYIAVERPDIALYVHEWQVTGMSQSDWRDGWAYATVERAEELGIFGNDAAMDAYLSEMKEYAAYFAGEVFEATHIKPVGPEFEIGLEGGYFTGRTLGTTETVGGYIAPGMNTDFIPGDFTASPVVGQVR